MSISCPNGQPGPPARPALFTRRDPLRRGGWRRLERRARTHFERDVLESLLRLAGQSPLLSSVDVTVSPHVDVTRLRLSNGILTLAGVHPVERAFLARASTAGQLTLIDGGRYGRYWWIRLSDGYRPRVVAGRHLRVSPRDCGFGADVRAPAPVSGRMRVAVG